MGVEFGVPTAKVPDTIGYHLLGMAFGPLFWNALSKVGKLRGSQG